MTTEEHLMTLIRTSLEMHRYWCETGHVRTEDRDAMVSALTALDLLPAADESTARADRYEAALRSIVDDPCADAGSDGYVIASEALAADPRPTEWTAHCPRFGSGESVDQRRGEPCPHCGDLRGHWPKES